MGDIHLLTCVMKKKKTNFLTMTEIYWLSHISRMSNKILYSFFFFFVFSDISPRLQNVTTQYSKKLFNFNFTNNS